jgi:hypothetical protein
VVISSSWRLGNLNQLMDIFGNYSTRVIGSTPHLPGKNRQEEIQEYLRTSQITKYLAVDDCSELFYSDCCWLFKTDYSRGLDDETTTRLISKLYRLRGLK